MSETPIKARALLLGHKIDLRRLQQTRTLARDPLTVEVSDGGTAVLFRFGVVVLFDVSSVAEVAFLEMLAPLIPEPIDPPETESLELRADLSVGDTITIEDGTLVLSVLELSQLQVVADIMAKSVLLADYERRVAASFDQIEPLADRLTRKHQHSPRERDLLQHIGETLRIQHRMVGRAQIGEKPDLLWERPDLERLYQRLEHEFEIRERHVALERKLDLVGTTAETLLDLLQSRRSLRVEWYIVILIVIEIFLTLYELFIRHRL